VEEIVSVEKYICPACRRDVTINLSADQPYTEQEKHKRIQKLKDEARVVHATEYPSCLARRETHDKKTILLERTQ
jgi:hypothetical protein